jgi:biotin operon repressor
MRATIAILIPSFALLFAAPAMAVETDWKKVDLVFGRSAAVSGAVHRYGLPRSDLKVSLDGVQIKPGFALGGWVAFEPMGDTTMMMGDLVLTEAEINPVMTKLLAEGLQVTAVHNHLLRANPPTFYMHVSGMGDAERLARMTRVALEESLTPWEMGAAPAPVVTDLGIPTAEIDKAIGFKGRNNNGVYQFGVPRSDSIKQGGMTIPGAMGVAIALNFQPTGEGKAAITGDFVALASEVNPLIKALRDSGIEVTAIHNHMLDDEPRAFFVHFWANDDAVKLAKGLRAALDAIHVAPNG